MSSSHPSPTDLLVPLLPPELEFKIFETCYFSKPSTLLSLLLVCQRVSRWINTVRYYSVQFRNKSDVEHMEAWLLTQSPASIHQNVKAILINLPDPSLYPSIQHIISTCTGVEYLGLWLNSANEDESPYPLLRTSLACLPQVRHLSLSPGSEEQLYRLLVTGASRTDGENEALNVAFRDTLTSIDWGWLPAIPLDTFPNLLCAVMQQEWPLDDEDMQRMKEWVSSPKAEGLILLAGSDNEIDLAELANVDGHVLHNEKVVLISPPVNWVKDWEAHVFGNGSDLFAIGKKLIGDPTLKNRVKLTEEP
ncbi:hypothetical protein DL96DRAFT_1585895 [Flagelloscypha sp. PMI_526]|nr:hypothetical protein DL96DRAFT_1585895 [Flagelloscypha sp. PMI_526]